MWVEVVAWALAFGSIVFAMVRRDKTGADRVADQRFRAWLLGLVGRKPGARLSSLRRAAGLPSTSGRYHLNILERAGLIHSARLHGVRRYFASEDLVNQAKGISVLRSGRIGRLVELILQNPGRCQIELATVACVDRKTFRDYVGRLKDQDLIDERREQSRRRYYPTPRLLELAALVNHDFSEEFGSDSGLEGRR
jgi:predicted transcriptional regulator